MSFVVVHLVGASAGVSWRDEVLMDFKALKSLYLKTEYWLCINGQHTDEFEVVPELRQGYLLSLLMVNLFVHDLTSKIKCLHCGVSFDNQ